MKTKSSGLTFRNFNRTERLPFVVYVNLKCTLEKKEGQIVQPTPINIIRRLGYYVSCAYNNSLSSFKSYRGEDCIAWFVNELHDLAHRVKAILTTVVSMTDLSWEEFHHTVKCHMCEKPFEPEDMRVREHCHLTGRYRDPTHLSCNLNYKDSHIIPVIFHNLSGYNTHFIIKLRMLLKATSIYCRW